MSEHRQDKAQAQRRVRLPVRLRRIEHVDGRDQLLTVRCPIAGGARTLEHCSQCQRFEALVTQAGESAVECRVPEMFARATEPGASLGEALASCAADLASPNLTCFDPEFETRLASQLLESDPMAIAPVVDDGGLLMGVVTAQALAQTNPPLEVEDAMSIAAATISQTASVGEAVRVMARLNLDRVPIVAETGELVGILTPMDVVRWLARQAH